MDERIKRIESIQRHILNVQENCNILGKKLIEQGKTQLGLALIANGQIHDNSKLRGIEFDFLNEETKLSAPEQFNEALIYHYSKNPHHPEHWGTIYLMPSVYRAEMIADWKTRCSELNSSVLFYLRDVGLKRFGIQFNDSLHKEILNYARILEKDIVNLKFGRLLVQFFKGTGRRGRMYESLCDCGNVVELSYYDLTKQKRTSCGKCNINVKYGKLPLYYFKRIQNSALNRKIYFNLSIEYCWNLFVLQNENCAISGRKLYFAEKYSDYINATASLDRIDSSKGYEINNVQWVHKDINYMKQEFSQEYFINTCGEISDYQKKLLLEKPFK